ncbi:MAG: LmeA family phospholipid-binding protein [Nitriliruptorales bacterium]|nr:LmeA family phospholipid-binding protein [Nitriliruptorales bacterium]
MLVEILVGLVLVAAVIGIGLSWAERRVVAEAHRRAEAALTEAFGVPVHVDLRGRPILLHLYRRHLPSAHLFVQGLPIRKGSAVLARLDVELTGVHLPPRGSGEPITADAGRFVARLDEDQAIALVELPTGARILRLTQRGFRLASTIPGVRVDARLEVRDNCLVVQPDRGLLTTLPWPTEFLVPLNRLPAGARVTGLRIEGRTLVISGLLDGQRLTERPGT